MNKGIKINTIYSATIKPESERCGANFISYEVEGEDNSCQMVKVFNPHDFRSLYNIPRFESGAPLLFGLSQDIKEEYEAQLIRMYERLKNFNAIIRHEHQRLYNYCRPSQLIVQDDPLHISKELMIIQPFDMSETCEDYLIKLRDSGDREYIQGAIDVLKDISVIISEFHKSGMVLLDVKMGNFVIYGPDKDRIALIDFESIRKIQSFKGTDGYISSDDADKMLDSLDDINTTLEYAPQELLHLVDLINRDSIPLKDFNETLNAIYCETYDWKVFGNLVKKWLLEMNVDYDLIPYYLKELILQMSDALIHDGKLQIESQKQRNYRGSVPVPEEWFVGKCDDKDNESNIIVLLDSFSRDGKLNIIQVPEKRLSFTKRYDKFLKNDIKKAEYGFDVNDLTALSSSLMNNHLVWICPESGSVANLSIVDAFFEESDGIFTLTPEYANWEKASAEEKEKMRGLHNFLVLKYMFDVDGRDIFTCLAEDITYLAKDPLKNGDLEYLIEAIRNTIGIEGGLMAFYIHDKELSHDDEIVIGLLVSIKIDVIIVSDKIPKRDIYTQSGKKITDIFYFDEKNPYIPDQNKKEHRNYSMNSRNKFVGLCMEKMFGIRCFYEEYETKRRSLYDAINNIAVDEELSVLAEYILKYEMCMVTLTGNSFWTKRLIDTSQKMKTVF